MFIFNKQTGKMLNLDKAVDIFPGRNAGTVTIGLDKGATTVFANYESEQEAKEMIAMLAEYMETAKREVFVTPEIEEVKARIANRRENWHHATGKKTKGYGGS